MVAAQVRGPEAVVVHGGGRRSAASSSVGKTSRFVNGLRVTDDDTMEVVEMVLGGKGTTSRGNGAARRRPRVGLPAATAT